MADNPTDRIINDVLRNPTAVDTLNVSRERGNDLTNDPGLARDLTEATYGELVIKYGPEVANESFRLQDSNSNIARTRRAERTRGEVVGDSIAAAGAGFVGLSGNTVGLAAGYGLGELALDDGRLGAVVTAELTKKVTGDIKGLQSDELKDRQRLQGIEGQLDSADSKRDFEQAIEAGDDPFMAALSRVGRDALNTGGRILNDAAITGDVVAESFGSLAPSAGLARVGGTLLGGAVARTTANETAKRVATTVGTTIGIGASEASGAYTDAVDKVMQMNGEQLAQSSIYQGLIQEGMEPARAQIELAAMTGETAFVRQMPTAVALGFLTSKFEAAPISSFAGVGIKGGLRNIALQGVEEAGQGGSAALTTNTALNTSGFETDLSEGVGEAAASGFIGGIGQAGVSAVPATVGATVDPTIAAAQLAAEVAAPVVQAASDRIKATDTSAQGRLATAAQEGSEAVVAEGVQDTEVQAAMQTAANIADPKVKQSEQEQVTSAAAIQKLRQTMNTLPEKAKAAAQKILSSKLVQAVEAKARKYDQNTQETPAQVTPEVEQETVAVARTNPANVSPEVVSKILEQNETELTETDIKVLEGASKIAATVNSHTEAQIAISEEKSIGLSKADPSAPVEAVLTPQTVSRSVLAQGYTDKSGKALRSVNDFASDIFTAAQSPDQTMVDVQGRTVPVGQIVQEFGNFIRHMNNKVQALNESFNQNNDSGRGPRINFESLVGGTTFIPAGDKGGAAPVAYHASKPGSVAFAKQVANDLEAAVGVFNQVAVTFPELNMIPVDAVKLAVSKSPETTKQDGASEATAEEVQSNESQKDVDDGKADTSVESNDTRQSNDTDTDGASTDDNGSVNSDGSTDTIDTAEASGNVDGNGSDSREQRIESEGTRSDTDIQIDQSDDRIVDDNGEPIKFYHGTNADFTDFRDGGIFLTTRKGLAREHARRGSEGTPRLIEAEVTLANPLTQQIPDDTDPDAYWLQNSLKIEEAKAAGGYDSIFLFNDKEGMVIADSNDQVNQTNRDFDGTVEAEAETIDTTVAPATPVHESFETAYTGEVTAPTLDEFWASNEANMNPAYVVLAKKLITPVVRRLNKRLDEKVTKIGEVSASIKDHILNNGKDKHGTPVQEIRAYRNTAIVDPATGEYNQNLVEMAGLAVMDWLSTATATRAAQLDARLDDLGITLAELTDAEYEAISNGVPVKQAVGQMAANTLKLWGVKKNPDATLGEIHGIVEGVINEYLTVLDQNTDLLSIEDIPVVVDGATVKTQTLNVEGVKKLQEQIRAEKVDGIADSAREAATGERETTYSVGNPIKTIASNQTRSGVKLSDTEKAAIKKMQDTPHYMNRGMAELTAALDEVLEDILGYVDPESVKNPVLQRSIRGKNLSIQQNRADTFEIMNALDDENNPPIYYPVGITKVGRHQFQGINPQSNKILRAVVSPTWTDVSFGNQDDVDSFWLGVAQASDLFKIEKRMHTDVLAEVQDKFFGKYRGAVNELKNFIRGDDFTPQAFANAVGNVEMQQIAAIFAVAEYEVAKERGDTEFRTNLSVELDGLTNGAANMMVNFGQGEITPQDYGNLARIGLFLGKARGSINEYFNAGRRDLYEVTADQSLDNMTSALKKLKPNDRKVLLAANRFASAFGNFSDTETEDGLFEMTRNTAKNPMTKVNYGSGVKGVGVGVAQDMILKFYEKTQGVGNPNLDSYFYAGLTEDMQTLFGSAPSDLKDGEFVFPSNQVENFEANVSQTLGKVLAESTQQVIGDKITHTNDLLVLATNVQTTYLTMKFEEMLNALAEKRATEGKMRRTAEGAPIMADMTQRDYNSVVRELSALAPLFVSDDQTLAISDFEPQTSDLVLSSNMDGKLNQKNKLPAPAPAGVKAIPFGVIGTGDAMMMNLVYSTESAMNDTLPIFDGIDVPVTKLKEYAQHVNKQVLASWDRDVMAMGVMNFEGFVAQTKNDPLLAEAFAEAFSKTKKENVINKDAQNLLEEMQSRLEDNRARKAVFKEIAVTVDQMGGSGEGFARGDQELTLSQINVMIEKKRKGVSTEKQVTARALEVTTANSLVRNLKMGPVSKKVYEAIKPLIPSDITVVTGTLDQLNEYRQENFAEDGQVLKGNGNFDIANNTLFLVDTKVETVLHELVHAATFGKVLDHYNGNTNPAVARLEELMDQFMGMKVESEGQRKAKAAILREQAQSTPAAQAAALNEYMAWGLTNREVATTLQSTKVLAKMAKAVRDLMKRIIGKNIPDNMFDQTVFATQILNAQPIDGGNGNDGVEGGDGTTPFTGRNISKWERRVNEFIDSISGQMDERANAGKLITQSNKVLDDLRQSGFLRDRDDRAVFRSIYILMGAEVQMHSQALVGLNKMLDHIIDNMSQDQFSDPNDYAAILSAMGSRTNREGNSDAVAVLLALSQTSQQFRAILDAIPEPEGNAQVNGSLNSFLAQTTNILMNKFTGEIDPSNKNVLATMNDLADSLLANQEEREFNILSKVTSTLDTMDKYTSGKAKKVAGIVADKNDEIRASDRSKWVKALSTSVNAITSQLDGDRASLVGSSVTSKANSALLDKLIPVRNLVNEVIGATPYSQDIFAMFDRVATNIAAQRQAFREDLPGILQRQFNTSPTAEQWTTLMNSVARADIASLVSVDGLKAITDRAYRHREITRLEKALDANYQPYVAQDIKDKAFQLAGYMNGGDAGRLLLRNAHAIYSLADEQPNDSLVETIDELVSLYAIEGLSSEDVAAMETMLQDDEQAVKGLVAYVSHLNGLEDEKGADNAARLNAYKGFIPNHGAGNTRIIIAEMEDQAKLERKGYKFVAHYRGDVDSAFPQGYFVSNIRQSAPYSQGVMQNVQATYKGVDMNSGLSVTSNTAGVISGDGAVERITDIMMDQSRTIEPSEALMPVFDVNGEIVAYEKPVTAEMQNQYNRDENLAVMMGAWHGRIVEEQSAAQFNTALIQNLHDKWMNREAGSDGEYLNVKTTDDPIYKESYKLMPQYVKNEIDRTFGEDGFMVRKDIADQSLGYRESSVTDMWSGKTRMPKEVQKVVQSAGNLVLGKHAMTVLSKTEEGLETVVSSAKDLIVIRSLIVPAANFQSNVIQLSTRGVPAKQIYHGFKNKLVEVEAYNKNVVKIMELNSKKLLETNPARKAAYDQQIEAIHSLTARMSIAPMIEAGAYKTLSEGLTDMDVAITQGKTGDFIQRMVDKLPNKVQGLANAGLVSKTTKVYQVANRATQYGDFLAKSIYYDHLMAQGLEKDEALSIINQEYVNFSLLPGRVRSVTERYGLSWFMAFKIRSGKIAANMLRDNPVRALAVNAGLPDVGTPVQDNVFSVAAEGRLDYALGWEMLFNSPELNPWVQLASMK